MIKEDLNGSNHFIISSEISLVDIAYFAGLFEGEGSVRKPNKATTWGAWQIAIAMTDKEPLERVSKIFGGTVKGPYNHKAPEGKVYKPHYRWYLHGYRTVKEIYDLIKSFLSPRRISQFEEAPSILPKEYPYSSINCGLGSSYGYDKHWKNGEIPCLSCRIAHARYQWERTHPEQNWKPTKNFWNKYGSFVEELIPHG